MIEYRHHVLSNGLRIVHHHDPGNPMVVTDIIYNVGARDESPELTGVAHLLEHLMFGGSVNIRSFDQATEAAGGMNNAWTSNDYTNYYDVFPAVNVETAFWLESDRMLSLAFDEETFETQRNVVIEEFKEVCLDQPYGDLWHHLRKLIYTRHPYRYPVIGESIDHIRRITLDDVKRFFFSHYAPNNAVLSVAGGVDFDTTCRLAEKWFGSIERRNIAPRLYMSEPEITSPREAAVEGNVPYPNLSIAYPMGGYHSPEYVGADLLTDILASGRSSRFYRDLLMKTGLFIDIDASILGSVEPGVLIVNGKLNDTGDAALEKARAAIDAALADVVTHGVTPHELRRAINRHESSSTFNNINSMAIAQNLAQAVMNDDDMNASFERYKATTTADIDNVARQLFDSRRACTLVYQPQEMKHKNN